MKYCRIGLVYWQMVLYVWGMENHEEKWLPVFGYEHKYEASDLGRIRRRYTNRVLKPRMNGSLLQVVLHDGDRGKSKSVKNLVYSTFHGRDVEPRMVLNRDGNGSNCRLGNLVLRSESTGNDQCPYWDVPRNPSTPLNADHVLQIRKLYDEFVPQTVIARLYSITAANVHKIIKRQSWKHIT